MWPRLDSGLVAKNTWRPADELFLQEILEVARKKNVPGQPVDITRKLCEVLVARIEYRVTVAFKEQRIELPPDASKDFWVKGQVQIIKSGCCDRKQMGDGAWAYLPWDEASDKQKDGFEKVFIRCRLRKLINVIPALDPYELMGVDFYLPWWVLRQIGYSLENEDPPTGGALEIRVPQIV
jgi:hypothetical protein